MTYTPCTQKLRVNDLFYLVGKTATPGFQLALLKFTRAEPRRRSLNVPKNLKLLTKNKMFRLSKLPVFMVQDIEKVLKSMYKS